MINHNNQIPKPKQLQFAAVKDDVLNNAISCVRDCSGILFTKGKKI